jgi:hypothetical protein
VESFLAPAAPFLGSAAGNQMIAAEQKSPEKVDSPDYSPAEIERRRATSRRLAWVLGLTALGIYLAGFLYYRP